MLFRAIALSLALLVGIGTIIPFMTDSTEAGPRHKKKKHKKLKKYSKAWWRWYHKQQKKKRALLARKRALRAKQILLARQKAERAKNNSEVAKTPKLDKKGDVREQATAKNDNPPTLPSGKKAPKSFTQSQASNSEMQFRVSDDNGNNLGNASLTVFGMAQGEDADAARSKTVGGIPTNNLRREVINRMLKEDGWVVNDYQKTVNGKKVYVVVAQSSVKGVVQSRQFYFTEVDGKVYTLATTSPNEVQDIIAQESEKVIQSLQRGSRPTQALNK